VATTDALARVADAGRLAGRARLAFAGVGLPDRTIKLDLAHLPVRAALRIVDRLGADELQVVRLARLARALDRADCSYLSLRLGPSGRRRGELGPSGRRRGEPGADVVIRWKVYFAVMAPPPRISARAIGFRNHNERSRR
jgi:hypothetical protein